MAEKDLGEGLEQLEEGIENLKNKEFKILGIKVTAVTAGAAFGVVSTVIGGLYGAFTVYNDYMDMKEQIQSYVAPDLSGFQEQISVMQQQMNATEDAVLQATDYARDIRNDLKEDVTRVEDLVDRLKDDVRASEKEVREMIDEADVRYDNKRDQLYSDTDRKIKELDERLSAQIQEALDNPLAN
jgi:vacuolar-type H+-ATPase subunit I/STV1